MTQPDQRCGTCKWWAMEVTFGDCTAPIPDCVSRKDSDFTHEDDGTTCPCWAPIENGETQA